MARLLAGPLLNQIRANILSRATGQPPASQQLFLFSGHDNNLAGLLKLLNVTASLTQPNYAACLVIELHRATANSGQRYVHVKWKNSASGEPAEFRQVEVMGCGSGLCPIERFMELSEGLVAEDFVRECGQGLGKGSMGVFYAMVAIASVAVAVVGVCGVHQLRATWRRRRRARVRLDLTPEAVLLMGSEDDEVRNEAEVFSRMGGSVG